MLSLDRITYLSLTCESFVLPDDFDAQTWFSNYFGVMVSGDTPVERIVLRAYGNECYALRDLPLHHSQKMIDRRADFEFDYGRFERDENMKDMDWTIREWRSAERLGLYMMAQWVQKTMCLALVEKKYF